MLPRKIMQLPCKYMYTFFWNCIISNCWEMHGKSLPGHKVPKVEVLLFHARQDGENPGFDNKQQQLSNLIMAYYNPCI